MATASKRVTHKDIRQPDWFQRTSDRALELLRQHQSKFVIAAGVLVLILLANWGWQIYKSRQDDQAAKDYDRAITLFQEKKYTEAIALFNKVQGFRWSRYAPLAHLYETNSYLALNDIEKAQPAAQRFLTATKPDTLYRQIGLVTLATIEERKNLCKQAIDKYAEAARIAGALKDRAILGKARCAAQNGDNKTAVDAYKEYLKENPNSPAPSQLAELEAKVGSQPATEKK
ncbi:MAG: tetratricopeptide repeat protein [Deltaproteobacteria bacterium]|nr:tetratricopeptide repeat protein [Deltaproteobacteria bacterium]